MVAYSFQKRFEDPIRSGLKRHTIRADRGGRSRHARPGERVQLYVGMRTRSCRLIAAPVCQSVWPIQIDLQAGVVRIAEAFTRMEGDLDAFAVSDGFASWDDLVSFWDAQHPGVLVFCGVMISWAPIAPEDLRPHFAGRGGQIELFPHSPDGVTA